MGDGIIHAQAHSGKLHNKGTSLKQTFVKTHFKGNLQQQFTT